MQNRLSDLRLEAFLEKIFLSGKFCQVILTSSNTGHGEGLIRPDHSVEGISRPVQLRGTFGGSQCGLGKLMFA